MLAQSFKTPAELDISEVVFDALVTVLGMLERGEIEPEKFDMNEWWEPRHDARGRFCGTVGCMGGWVSHVARKAGHDINFVAGGGALYELFQPKSWHAWDASRAQAAQALRNYLSTGEACWEEAMAS